MMLYLTPTSWSHRYGDGIFTISQCNATVVEEHKYAQYQIEVRCGDHTKVINRRYSEFHQLQTILNQDHILDEQTIKLFPPKTWFASVDPDFLEQRAGLLHHWLDTALSSNKLASTHPQVIEFLQLVAVPAT
jgi:hypothetical protein